MELELLGWPEDGPTLNLDHRRFSYAGKFVMSSTGKAVGRVGGAVDQDDGAVGRMGGAADPDDDDGAMDQDDDEIVAAVAFSEDRTDPKILWIRYVTVRQDRRGEGLGPQLVRFVVARARERGYERVRIAVNNPYAYEALHRAGFGFTGERTGIAELVLAWPSDRSAATYRAGLAEFEERDLSKDEQTFVDRRRAAGPPDVQELADDEVPGNDGS